LSQARSWEVAGILFLGLGIVFRSLQVQQ
jgi:hypothetical protein